MDIYVLNQDFQIIYVLDTYESLLWVDRLYKCGSFEIYSGITKDILEYVRPDNYLVNPDSEHVMIVEDISIESDTESGDHIKIVGRSLESILDRRIVWAQTTFNKSNLQNAVKKLITDAIINPKIKDRRISNFIFHDSTDSRITRLTLTKQYTGDNLLEVIESICEEGKIGYKITLDDEYNFVFSFYLGTDRSYMQTDNLYVVFSPSFDNIINSNYTDKRSEMKNVTLVAGEGEGSSRLTKTVGARKGLKRKELFTDARDIQKGDLSKSKYLALLEKRGTEKLSESSIIREFDGKCDTSQMYIYGNDFFLGDVVQIANEYGTEASATITEFTWSYSSTGKETYPTFETVEDTVITHKNVVQTTLDTMIITNTDGEWADNIYEISGLVVTVNQDGNRRVIAITVEGVATSDISINVGNIVTDVTSLTLSGTTGGSSTTYRLTARDETSGTNSCNNYNGGNTWTTYLPEHQTTLYIMVTNGTDVDTVFYPMVRDSSISDDSFEPYDGN